MLKLDRASQYNPFLGDTIGLFDQSSSASQHWYGETMTDVDLYYQPLQTPTLAVVYLILKSIIIIAGEYIHIRILNFFRHENFLVNDLLKLFLYVQMFYWPVVVLFKASTDFVYPLQEIGGEWVCNFGWWWIILGMTIIFFHSFMVGLLRYLFVVHNKWINSFGKERVKRAFLWASILIPIFCTIWRFYSRPELSAISSLNKCKGITHKAFLIENRIHKTAQIPFCGFGKYDEDGGEIIAILKMTACTLNCVILAIMGLNLIEGLFYWKTVKHANK